MGLAIVCGALSVPLHPTTTHEKMDVPWAGRFHFLGNQVEKMNDGLAVLALGVHKLPTLTPLQTAGLVWSQRALGPLQVGQTRRYGGASVPLRKGFVPKLQTKSTTLVSEVPY